MLFREGKADHINCINEEYTPRIGVDFGQANTSGHTLLHSRILDKSNVSREIKDDDDAEQTIYMYEAGNCVGRMPGEDGEQMEAALDATWRSECGISYSYGWGGSAGGF
jgi:hypothetical protein